MSATSISEAFARKEQDVRDIREFFLNQTVIQNAIIGLARAIDKLKERLAIKEAGAASWEGRHYTMSERSEIARLRKCVEGAEFKFARMRDLARGLGFHAEEKYTAYVTQ